MPGCQRAASWACTSSGEGRTFIDCCCDASSMHPYPEAWSPCVDEALLDRYAYVPILLDASVVDYNHGSREALAGCRHHCASGSSEHRPLAHTLSANHHAVGTYLTYYSTKLCVVTFLVPCVIGLCHVRVMLMGSFVMPDLCTPRDRNIPHYHGNTHN